jgi:hypothetical protein
MSSYSSSKLNLAYSEGMAQVWSSIAVEKYQQTASRVLQESKCLLPTLTSQALGPAWTKGYTRRTHKDKPWFQRTLALFHDYIRISKKLCIQQESMVRRTAHRLKLSLQDIQPGTAHRPRRHDCLPIAFGTFVQLPAGYLVSRSACPVSINLFFNPAGKGSLAFSSFIVACEPTAESMTVAILKGIER